MHQKLIPEPFLIFINNPKYLQEISIKIRYFERGSSKSINKLTLFLLSNPDLFNGKNDQKQKGTETRDQLLLLAMY